ncbi:hypothetical protein NCS52_01575400 [Fusarium sp. LHS14.1]|nr:hypothetical protein NCS52_01575400 [Fusarium sp. LHS14.1]
MGPLTPFQHFSPFFVLSLLTFAQTAITIEDDIPSDGYECISSCIHYPGVVGEAADIGTALACGTPYENDCYCATASASASAVSSFIDDCGGIRGRGWRDGHGGAQRDGGLGPGRDDDRRDARDTYDRVRVRERRHGV